MTTEPTESTLKRFRRLNAPELLAKVYAGVWYEDGVEVAREEAAA